MYCCRILLWNERTIQKEITKLSRIISLHFFFSKNNNKLSYPLNLWIKKKKKLQVKPIKLRICNTSLNQCLIAPNIYICPCHNTVTNRKKKKKKLEYELCCLRKIFFLLILSNLFFFVMFILITTANY